MLRHRHGLFFRLGFAALVLAALRRRRRWSVLALLALALSAAVVTALLTLYRGVQSNLSTGFRNYGANLMVLPKNGAAVIPLAAAAPVLAAYPDSAGELYAVGAAGGRAIAIAGADLVRLQRLNPEWETSGVAASGLGPGDAWIGVNAARLLGLQPGSTIAVAIAGHTRRWRVAGTVASGGSEDNQLLAPYAAVTALAGTGGYSALALRVDAASLAVATQGVQAELPDARVQPVRQLAAGESAILLSTGTLLFASTGLILLAVALCVAASLVTLALERRRDFGLMKALGAGEAGMMLRFTLESALLGCAAAVAGIAAGAGVASLMGYSMFHLWLRLDPLAAAAGAATTLVLAVLAALAPWPILHRASPAAMLQGG